MNDEEQEIALKEARVAYDKVAAEFEAWREENKDSTTGFGMLYDESAEDPGHDLTFSVDVKWAEEYTKESRWDGPGADELEEILTEAVRHWARVYAPKGTFTSFLVVDK